LPRALAAVADGGEIWMLDSANYNNSQVDVTKSVTILAVPGALGSVVATGGGDGLFINTSTAKVTLRNLVIVSIGSSIDGVGMSSGSELNVIGCDISGTQFSGIAVFDNTATVTIVDTNLRHSQNGFYARGAVKATLNRVRSTGHSLSGVFADDGANVAITDSVLANNPNGLVVQAVTIGSGLTAARNTFQNNGTAVLAQGSGQWLASAWLDANVIAGQFGQVAYNGNSTGLISTRSNSLVDITVSAGSVQILPSFPGN